MNAAKTLGNYLLNYTGCLTHFYDTAARALPCNSQLKSCYDVKHTTLRYDKKNKKRGRLK